MKMVAIDSNELINLDLVESAVLKNLQGKQTLVLFSGGKEYRITKDPLGLFKSLIDMSMEENMNTQRVTL